MNRLEAGLTSSQRSELVGFVMDQCSRYPGLSELTASLSAVTQETATAWAHSEDSDHQRIGLLVLTCCTEYPESMLALCEVVATQWTATGLIR
jgi:hypothetical protein